MTVADTTTGRTVDSLTLREPVDAQQLLRGIPDQLLWLNRDGRVLAVKPATNGSDIVDDHLLSELRLHLRRAIDSGDAVGFDYVAAHEMGDLHVEARIIPGDEGSALVILRNVTDERRLENDLQQARRLEAIGRLAGGIAHEINTPIQFIGDNVRFLRDAFAATIELVTAYRACLFSDREMSRQERVEIAESAEQQADVAFLTEEVPPAVEETLDGVRRVAAIVKAMKVVGAPGQTGQRPADLNAAIESTVVVTRSEYKQVATLELDLGELPPVMCRLGQLNQVLLNLIVNAAHAIADTGAERGGLGVIRIRTRHDGDDVVVNVSDDGCGIPDEIQHRIFEQFFTTKEVGRGTGQGLALARSVVVDHDGSLTVDSTAGEGTTFTLRLPVGGARTGAPAAGTNQAG